MPIHVSWKSMAEGMRGTYKSGKTKCRSFSDGSKVCMSKKAWQVFFATINKMGADETKPRPKKTQESREKLIDWFMESRMKNDDNEPKWIKLAEKIIKSENFNPKVKAYWRSRLQEWCKEHPDSKTYKGLKI